LYYHFINYKSLLYVIFVRYGLSTIELQEIVYSRPLILQCDVEKQMGLKLEMLQLRSLVFVTPPVIYC